jgi:hypothetical protein
MQSDSMSTLMQSSGWASSATQQPQQYLQSSSPGITNQQSGNNNNSSPQNSAKAANFAASVIKPRMQMEPNKMELEVCDIYCRHSIIVIKDSRSDRDGSAGTWQ